MRLERLSLAPYGRFADRVLNFRPGAALHVVLGANESGKTTSLSAIGDLLFGFPTQTPYGFAHKQAELRVGGVLGLSDGTPLEFRRRKGNKNTLVDAQDQPISDEILRRALGQVDRKIFESEFGLTAQTLREGGEALLRAGGGLAETLAAGSAGLSALTRLRAQLAEQADGLFTTRRVGSKPFYLALDRFDEADKRLRDSIVTADALKTAEAAERDARAREIDLKNRHEETGRALARWQRAQRTRAKLGRLSALSHELAAFADLPALTPAMLAPWRVALAERADLAEQYAQLAADEARDEAEIAALGVDEAVLAGAGGIDALRERLGAVRKAKEDLPRRVTDHHSARSQLDGLARRLGLADHEALLAATPTDAAVARARALIAARRRAEERRAESLTRRDRALAERERLRAVAGAAALDPEPFKRRLATLADAAADSERSRRERAATEAEARALAEETARLTPRPGDADALARLALPEPEELARAARDVDEAAQALRAAELAARAARDAAAMAEAALAKRASESAGATRADWFAARERRESALDRLGASLDAEAAERRLHFDSARALVLAADATADSVLTDTERAARLQAAREELVARKEEARRAEETSARARTQNAEAFIVCGALWTPSGLTPTSPADMIRWRERAAAILARRADLAKRQVEIEALTSKLEGAGALLASWLKEFGSSADAAQGFEILHRLARAHLDHLQAEWARSRQLEGDKARAETDASEAEAAFARESEAHEARLREWPSAMAGIGLGGVAGLEEAEAALQVWENVARPHEKMLSEGHRVVTMREDIASFEAAVVQAAKAAPGLPPGTAEETLSRLAEKLVEARRANDARERLRARLAKRSLDIKALDRRRETLAAPLAAARRALFAEDDEALGATLERLGQRELLETERAALLRDLADISDGLDEGALRAEQADLDPELLPGNIDLARQTQEQLLREIGEAAIAASEAKARLDKLSLGRDANLAARDRREAGAELVEIAERWIVRQAASRLAARAIERHRAAAQDPLVTRAGELFAMASAGAFAGLGADYDDTDRPMLVARRAGGERVKVEGLSEGARDQLFLALRLALLERRAGEPLPFIGDDILASFDDERTLRTLSLLSEFGKARQAIVFTHHRHVADLARAVAGEGIDVLEI